MREKFARFFVGRNGSDQLARCVSVISLILLVLSLVIKNDNLRVSLWLLAIIGIIYVYFRVFSRNVYKRQAENSRYLAKIGSIKGYFRSLGERWRMRKDYRFFRCPSCRTMLRVPKGKGKLKVVCRKCGTSFVRKS